MLTDFEESPGLQAIEFARITANILLLIRTAGFHLLSRLWQAPYKQPDSR
jgi:hypothetical protein